MDHSNSNEKQFIIDQNLGVSINVNPELLGDDDRMWLLRHVMALQDGHVPEYLHQPAGLELMARQIVQANWGRYPTGLPKGILDIIWNGQEPPQVAALNAEPMVGREDGEQREVEDQDNSIEIVAEIYMVPDDNDANIAVDADLKAEENAIEVITID